MASKRAATVSKKYQKKSHLQHIKERPDTYIGSCGARTDEMWVLDGSRMVHRPCTFVPGLYKIFDEILVNAADNKRRDSSMRTIRVNITNNDGIGVISVENDGAGVPVEMHATEKMFVPQMVFGELLSGDNYDDSEERVVGGRNGYGAKLANIFSTVFCVETVDSKSKKRYSQTWRNNMSTCSKPTIKASGKKKDFTKITFAPDFAKFGLTGFTSDILALFHKRVYDLAGTTPPDVRVYLNNVKLPISNFKQYCALYFEDDQKMVYEQINERWEICVTVAPDQQPQQVSFANAICTLKGGEHVKYVLDDIAKHIIPHKSFKDLSVKNSQVRNSTFLFVNALINNPSFDSQTKETLTTRSSAFGPARLKPKISEKCAKAIAKKSGIIDEILFYARAKSRRQLERKTGGAKKTKLNGVPKLDDANWAGGRRSEECTLILTEGDSAKTLAIAGLSVIGRDKYGVFPLKGKLKNVRDASNASVMNNAEIQNIMKIMGLNIGRTYADAAALRYGHIMIMTDQDHDGSHIKGLIINFLHHFWPSLLAIPNFLQVFITPIVKCTPTAKTKTPVVFYTTPEYEAWQEEDPAHKDVKKWRPKYYKGLGTSDAKEAKEYFSNLQRNQLHFGPITDSDGVLIDMCFNKKRVTDRKQWISGYEDGTHMDFNQREMRYSDFVNKEYIIMAVQSNLRGIPHVMDGLKPSQRKILFACLKRKLHHEIKVAQLAGYTSEHAAYHHGEASLNSTIVNMAQDYVGSNNINILMPNGQFGTRLMGGKDDASPRYIFTQLNPITEMIFHPSDSELYTYLEDDGQKIEPAFYLPVLPMLLVNGAAGIGTGWSTSIPPFNPLDIIDRLSNIITGKPVQPMTPWFRGFTGSVQAIPNASKYLVFGKWSWSSARTLVISELPVGTWTNNYKEFLEKALDGQPPFKKEDVMSVQSNHTDTSVHFTIKFSASLAEKLRQDEQLLIKKFKLVSTVDTANMHAFDATGTMKKYRNELEILREFFVLRLEFYKQRKQRQLDNLQLSLNVLQQKVRFLQMVVNGEFTFKGRRKDALIAELLSKQIAQLNGSFDYLLNMPMWNMTADKIQEFVSKGIATQEQISTLAQCSPETLWLHDLNVIKNKLTESSKKKLSKKRGLVSSVASRKKKHKSKE
mgnify:CR=1 FL=1